MQLSSLNIPYLSDDSIRQHAEELRAMFSSPGLPVDVDLICEKAGIDLRPIPNLKYLSSTEACISNDASIIFYDVNSNELRLRFSLAHELGHFKIHRAELDMMRPRNIEDWKKILDEIPGHTIGRFEKQANEFAGRLLVPIDELKNSFKIVKDDLLIMKGFFKGDYFPCFQFIASPLSKRFGVSEKVMQIRLEKENLNPYLYL